jgi:hypothetical protein
MPKYKVVLTENHRVSSIFTDEFDTKDADQWEQIKASAEFQMDPTAFAALPEKPPKDPAAWFAVYRYVDALAYANREDDWITSRKGGYETSIELQDKKGNVLDSD